MAVKNSKTCYLEDNVINLKDINGVDHEIFVAMITDGYDHVFYDIKKGGYYLYYHATAIWQSEEDRLFKISKDTYNETIKLIEEVIGNK